MATSLNDFQNGYQAGFQDGFKAGLAQGESPMIEAGPGSTTKPKPKPKSETRTWPKQGTQLAKKYEMLKHYLTSRPGARWRNVGRDLPEDVAKAIYGMVNRGFVRKDDDGRFFLIDIS